MPHKPVSTFSEAVKVSLDEITTELLRRVPEAQVADAISSACTAAEKRLRSNRRSRHDRYHSQMFFRRMVERFPNAPEGVSAVVGLKNGVNGAQMEVPGVEVRQSGEERMPTENAQAVDEVLEDPAEDEFADILDIPKFEDFEAVFNEYPYVMPSTCDGRKVLVLGYLSARDHQTDDLIRRNCVVIGPSESGDSLGTPFNDLQSITGILRRTKQGVRQFIKVIPYQVGTRIRFWTHVKGPNGSGDRPNLNRYVVVGIRTLIRPKSRAELAAYPATKGIEA